MLASQQLMDTLKGIGLNLYERKLWVALLAKGVATAGELSTLANVPRSRTYDVLQTLAEKGYVIVQSSKPLKYVAVPPAEALDRVKNKMKLDYEARIERIERLKKSPLLAELEEIHKKGLELISPEDISGALKGKYSVMQQMDSMFKAATNSINIVTTPSGLNELYENHFNMLKNLKQKGIDIKIAARIDDSCAEAVKALSGIAEIRKIVDEKTPIFGKFYIVDNQQTMMSLTHPEANDTQHMMFWTKSEHATKDILHPVFQMVWQHSIPLNKQ
ncbi:MAG: helix-turn-helix domain-containing protein [Candidatus Aenigmatarchaeota archaeon]